MGIYIFKESYITFFFIIHTGAQLYEMQCRRKDSVLLLEMKEDNISHELQSLIPDN